MVTVVTADNSATSALQKWWISTAWTKVALMWSNQYRGVPRGTYLLAWLYLYHTGDMTRGYDIQCIVIVVVSEHDTILPNELLVVLSPHKLSLHASRRETDTAILLYAMNHLYYEYEYTSIQVYYELHSYTHFVVRTIMYITTHVPTYASSQPVASQ
jgi:hypothetical protein